MEELEVEENRTFGLCKCCLQDGYFKSLWTEYEEKGAPPNYGQMLNDCFSLHWQQPDNTHLEQICDDCIRRTEDACSFRKQVLSSQEQLESRCKSVELTEVLDPESGQMTLVKEEYSPRHLDEVSEEYQEVEFLEIEVEDLINDPQHNPEQPVKSKWPSKKKKGTRTYKNYSNEDFKQCIEAVQSYKMTIAQAAAHYKVPRKTVAAKILSYKRGEPVGVKADKNMAMIDEVQTLLTYTNATPYKTRTARYYCAYCSTDGPQFDDPDELRTHTRTKHAGERTKSVEKILRPLWLNEVLKVDIDSLLCNICCVPLVSWNDMFKHLKETHNLDFDEAYNRVIPYILKSELRCALCKAAFPNYHQLDGHMNAHYNSYMCSECGDTFLAASRLKKHLAIHDTGRFACKVCGKVFALEKYRKKHIELVHMLQQNIRCLYCPEKFLGTYARHLHVTECHPEKVKSITCELCGKIFDWRPYFLAHVRRKHNCEKNYQCSFCETKFFMKSELRRHEQAHKNTGGFVCVVCGKCYDRKAELVAHQTTHDVGGSAQDS